MKPKLKQGQKSDTRYELALIANDCGSPLEEVALDYWGLMLINEDNILDPLAREIAAVNYLETKYQYG